MDLHPQSFIFSCFSASSASSTSVRVVTSVLWLRERLWVICCQRRNTFLASHHTCSCKCATALTLHFSYDLSYHVILCKFVAFLMACLSSNYLWPFDLSLFETEVFELIVTHYVSSDLFVQWEKNSWHLCFHDTFKIWPIFSRSYYLSSGDK